MGLETEMVEEWVQSEMWEDLEEEVKEDRGQEVLLDPMVVQVAVEVLEMEGEEEEEMEMVEEIEMGEVGELEMLVELEELEELDQQALMVIVPGMDLEVVIMTADVERMEMDLEKALEGKLDQWEIDKGLDRVVVQHKVQ